MEYAVNKLEVLEELYNRLPNREADTLIDLILEDDPSGVEQAEHFLNGKNLPKQTYNLFQSIKEKPIYKTVHKFMEGELEDNIQVLKMLSSILTQIFIQCELRNLNPDDFNLVGITDLVLGVAKTNEITNSLANEIKSIIIELGYNRQ